MSNFTFKPTPIKGLTIIEPKVYGDARGFFMESYCERDFVQAGIVEHFVQDNHSCSSRGVLRGLHMQSQYSQGKLIRVVRGSVLDVAVDLRVESPTFGKWHSVVLSAENHLQFYVPPRFAHGFLTLEDGTEFLYKCTEYYAPQFDGGVLWCDPTIGVDWRLSEFGLLESELLLSPKDRIQPQLEQLDIDKLFKD